MEKEEKEVVLTEEEVQGVKSEISLKEEPKEEKKEVKAEPKKADKIKYNDERLARIEEHRLAFYQIFKKQNILKWVVSVIAIALLIFAFLAVPNMLPGNDYNALRISLMITLAAISLGLMLAYSLISKRYLNKKLRVYFDNVNDELTSFLYTKEGLELVPTEEKMISRIQYEEAGFFKDIVQVNSRGLQKLKYHGLEFFIVDAAAQINNGKAMAPVFVGKYLVTPTTYEGDTILVYLKGDKRSIAPNKVDELKLVFDNEKMAIFSNEPNWNKVVNAKFKQALERIKLDNTLIDIQVILRNKKAYISMNYDDSLMVLALENPYNPFPTEEFKEDFEGMLDFITLINK